MLSGSKMQTIDSGNARLELPTRIKTINAFCGPTENKQSCFPEKVITQPRA